MTPKTAYYATMAEDAARQVTGSWERWTSFLTTAGRLYKYPYHEQLMIHAQRPDATACAEYDLWNDKMNRYVKRGSKGIALLDYSRDKPRLKYVFEFRTPEPEETPVRFISGRCRMNMYHLYRKLWKKHLVFRHKETHWIRRLMGLPDSSPMITGRNTVSSSSTSLQKVIWKDMMNLTQEHRLEMQRQ